MSRPVSAIVGVGPGDGAAFASKFSNEGYAVALRARTRQIPRKPDDFFLKPARSGWSFEIDLHPFCEKW